MNKLEQLEKDISLLPKPIATRALSLLNACGITELKYYMLGVYDMEKVAMIDDVYITILLRILIVLK